MLNRVTQLIRRHPKASPVVFFIIGFVWDSLTLRRIDRLYENTVLCFYLISLSVCLYLYNLADDGRWKETFIEKYEEYLPLAIQFFLGGLCSAYVIFYSRSVSFSKTVSFFLILVVLLFANELLKQRISNKYLQFGSYFFVCFTFFTFFIPVMTGVMNTLTFILSGLISLTCTLLLIAFIYWKSPTTRAEISGKKTSAIIVGIYILINTFYYFNMIPPVPLALQDGFVAHDVTKENGNFIVSYEKGYWYKFWKPHRETFHYTPGDSVFVYTSIFAPTDLKKRVYHHWRWFNTNTEKWETTDRIEYDIIGGRDGGYRGYTFKANVKPGKWKIDVRTEENLVLGIIDFRIPADTTFPAGEIITETYH